MEATGSSGADNRTGVKPSDKGGAVRDLRIKKTMYSQFVTLRLSSRGLPGAGLHPAGMAGPARGGRRGDRLGKVALLGALADPETGAAQGELS